MISARYNPKDVEERWYDEWESKGYFKSNPDDREAFSIVIPPPNVTGVLHMGHMLNNTIQDILIRKARQEGKNACWVPGTDHASIATEAKVVKMLREKGIKKSDLSREEFLNYAWQWKEEYGGIILKQLRKLGASCDWDRTAFTMDEVRSKAVYKAFVDLYRKNKLYRGNRMVNWDPEAKTVLSNEEVIFGLEQSKLYHVRYQIVGTEAYVTIATTRPETIPGDTAIAVHPDDERYAWLKGKKAIVPIINREIPIIFDDYVDREFGTGALKVTPAHDVNDHEIGKRHQLEIIDIFNPDGTMSDDATVYLGEDRFVVRKKFSKDLEEAGHIVNIEDYQNNVGRSERTNAVVEPRLSLQWYVDMGTLSDPALKAVMDDVVEFFPKSQKNIYRHWMENIKDWCISRQLWWGHRIPAWYFEDQVFVAETAKEAFKLAQKTFPTIQKEQLIQDEDVLDTWFSSWLWPISVFDGFEDKEVLNYYYPTSVLVTGWDIIFLWVARMVMAGYEWTGTFPFEKVYFTGMVRDKQRRKMSKQLGNSPDALQLIADYGADGVRFGMMSCSPAGGDLLFDEKLVEQGRNFCNKMWNALRLLKSWETENENPQSDKDRLAGQWMMSMIASTQEELVRDYKDFRLSEGLMKLYNLIWNEYCSWYLEMIKPQFGEKIHENTYQEAIDAFSQLCSILHPFMPFITEEIWHLLKDRSAGEDCIISTLKIEKQDNNDVQKYINTAKDIITSVREIRQKQAIKMKDELQLYILKTEGVDKLIALNGWEDIVKKLAILDDIIISDDLNINGISFISGTEKCMIQIHQELDIEGELISLQKDLDYQQGFVDSVTKKLSNERFVQNAKPEIVEKEQAKLADGQERIKILTEEIQRLQAQLKG
ncbi:MAG: valine--tRNA ligase [Lewinellaceae bacterium]|nr:valine--tRNA ligase [Lewinellaceae bacterium]